jgi:hypothetical protein
MFQETFIGQLADLCPLSMYVFVHLCTILTLSRSIICTCKVLLNANTWFLHGNFPLHETVYPFSVALYTSNLMFWLGVAHLLLIFCVTFSFVCLPSSHCVLYWRCLYNYRSSFSLHFLYFTSSNQWENDIVNTLVYKWICIQ